MMLKCRFIKTEVYFNGDAQIAEKALKIFQGFFY